MQKEEIIKAILRYMFEHPQACDSIEGIIDWWVVQGRISIQVEEATDAVRDLVTQGFLVRAVATISSVLYAVNKEKLSEIKMLLQK